MYKTRTSSAGPVRQHTIALSGVAVAVGQVDTSLCAGLDTLVTKLPTLKDTTPALCATTIPQRKST